jgi:branched-chain amino acid transport system ATP-binding protein
VGRAANILELRDVSLSYGLVRGLQSVTLQVPHGRCVAVVGANGAGKTSLVRVISGLLPPAGGTITIDGQDASKISLEKRVRQGLAVVPEGRGVVPRLTVDDNLLLGSYVHPKKARSNADRAYAACAQSAQAV